ncbi:MAG: YicC/YloC family endoribonuclease [Nitrosomonas sp.]|nr:YicC/YloC family endoribonuclease [Nitrosomonas sp.]MDP1950139.1 YicC/YloC family endoribonuclease [Nitrosomonas sp.]
MTGYAITTKEIPCGSLNLELRSVNSRFLDIQFRMPDEFRLLESTIRDLLKTQINRGKIECRLNFSSRFSTEHPQQINPKLLQKLVELNHSVKLSIPEAQSLGVADILQWPGMLESDTLPIEDLHETSLALLKTALTEFSATRMREGEKLKIILLTRVNQMRQLLLIIAPKIPALLAEFDEKLRSRLQDATINLEDDRIRQEISLFAGKIDVDEELSRLHTHLDEVERILSKGGSVGKRLDFMMQELNREANTIGSKSVDMEISRISIELKILIEQMREQIQNIE